MGARPSTFDYRPASILGVEEVEAVCCVKVDVTFSHSSNSGIYCLVNTCSLESIFKMDFGALTDAVRERRQTTAPVIKHDKYTCRSGVTVRMALGIVLNER